MFKIAISGKANSGKNTLAHLLIEELDPLCYYIDAFANPIKSMIEQMIPNVDKNCLYGSSQLRSKVVNNDLFDKNGKPLTYRQLLIDLGTLGRSYNKNIWINKIEEKVLSETQKMIKTLGQSNYHKKSAYIITDCRFENEAEWLKNNYFYLIRIKRKDNIEINDATETAQDIIKDDFFDFIINNDSDLDSLRLKVKNIVAKIEPT